MTMKQADAWMKWWMEESLWRSLESEMEGGDNHQGLQNITAPNFWNWYKNGGVERIMTKVTSKPPHKQQAKAKQQQQTKQN